MASVNNIDAHIDRIDDGVKLGQVVFLWERAFISANPNWADFEVFVVNKLLKVHGIEFIHELFALFFSKRSIQYFYRLFRKLVEYVFSMVRIELFRKLNRVRK